MGSTAELVDKDAAPSLSPTSAKLTEEQRNAFEEFKALCLKNGQVWPVSPTQGTEGVAAHDDAVLLRFLRARSYNPQAAFKQYSGTIAHRQKEEIVKTYDNADVAYFDTITRLFNLWTGRRDKEGIPVCVYAVGAVKTEDLLAMSKADPELKTIFLQAEYFANFVNPLCTTLNDNGNIVDQTISIIDLNGVGIRHFWQLRTHLQKASQMATAHYPETVKRMFVVGAPWFFTKIWHYITLWFDAHTTGKIFVLESSQVFSKLSEFIEPDNIPKQYGGNLDWNYGMYPRPDAETKALLPALGEGWVGGPLRFFNGTLLAVGTENDKERRSVVGKIDGKDTTVVGIDTAVIEQNDEKSPLNGSTVEAPIVENATA